MESYPKEPLTELKSLLFQLAEEEWGVDSETQLLQNLATKLKPISKRIHPASNQVLPILEQCVQHANWKLHVCAILFELLHTYSKELYWKAITDPEPHVQEYLFRMAKLWPATYLSRLERKGKIPELPKTRAWADLLFDLFEGKYPDYNFRAETILETLGPVVTQMKEKDLLIRLTTLCSQYIEYDTRMWEVKGFQYLEQLFNAVLAHGWLEGAQYLLDHTLNTVLEWCGYDQDTPPVQGSTALVTMLQRYLKTNGVLTAAFVKTFLRLYPDYTPRFPHPEIDFVFEGVQSALTQVGQKIAQDLDTRLRDFCLEHQFLLPLEGMLNVTVPSKNSEWVLPIFDSFLTQYQRLWEKAGRDPSKRGAVTNPPTQDYWAEIGSSRSPYTIAAWDYLSVFHKTIKIPPNPKWWGEVLDDLYTRHNSWVLELLEDLLFTKDLSTQIQTLGMIWRHSSIPARITPPSKRNDPHKLYLLLQACAGEPNLQKELMEYIQNPNYPDMLRFLALCLLIPYGTIAYPEVGEFLQELVQNQLVELWCIDYPKDVELPSFENYKCLAAQICPTPALEILRVPNTVPFQKVWNYDKGKGEFLIRWGTPPPLGRIVYVPSKDVWFCIRRI